MNYDQIKSALSTEPRYRVGQALRAIYNQSIGSWQDLTAFPKALRERLEAECPIAIDAEQKVSADGKTVKALFVLPGGAIEAVLMRHEGRNTVCVSTQIGCALACDFCLTGTMGFTRNLGADEMINQVLFFNRYLKSFGERTDSVVFMGMGEPMNNYDNMMAAITRLNDPELFGIGARHISISTAGVVPGIRKLADEKLQVNLGISLHAPTDELRSQLMPINNAFPLEMLLKAVKAYIAKSKRRVMLEYIMLKDVNDSPRDADKLVKLLQKHLDGLYFVNLIRYNDTGRYAASNRGTVDTFKRILNQSGVPTVERYRFGQDIKGACGQLFN